MDTEKCPLCGGEIEEVGEPYTQWGKTVFWDEQCRYCVSEFRHYRNGTREIIADNHSKPTPQAEIIDWKSRYEKAESELAKAQEFCEWLQGRLGKDPCRYDHDGHCQEHSDGSKWTHPCRKPQLDEWLEKRSKS